MSKKKRPNAANDIYAYHMAGGLGYNSAMGREVMIENMYMRMLTDLAVNRFKWIGLPPQINQRFLELTLFYNGMVLYFEDENLGQIAVKATPNGAWNWQNDPTGFTITANGYYRHAPVSAARAVPIWCNYLRTPDLDVVAIFANRLAQIDRTLEINTEQLRNTRIVRAGENQRLSYENINRQISEGQPVIRVSESMSVEDVFEVLDFGLDATKTILPLDMYHSRQWGKCMGLLGIEFANQDKKERLVAAEVDANEEQTDSIKLVNLNSRREAAERINAMFHTNIRVEYNTEVETQAKQVFNAFVNSIDDGSAE